MTNHRREFLKKSTLAGIGLMVAPSLLGKSHNAGEKVVIGIVGTNSRGAYLARLFSQLKDVEIGYICDVDQKVIDRTVAEIEKTTGKKPKTEKDVRKLVEAKDLDAVVIAAPDHWHAPAALMAVKAGKHVYVEKPCSHNPAEGEMLVAAAEKYNRLIQMGNQRRSFPRVMEAMQSLHEGIIGRVYFAKGWYANARKSIGTGKVAPVPAHLDYELWQGPAPRRPYKDNLIHYNWHWFWNWGTGEALNNGTHEIDVMRWGLGVEFPTKVVSAGGRYAFQDDWETPDTQTITFEFANRTSMTWEGRSCNDYDEFKSGRGVIFYGEKGTMVIPGGDDYKVYDLGNKLTKEVNTTIQKADATNTMGMGEKLDSLHLQNFVDAVRGKAKLNSPISEGFKSTLLPQLGNIAWRTNHVLNCDPANGHIKDDAAASALWSREYEKGWEMKL
ncbi:MAG: Gfo/Idh/MocA family oxidoreductase [Bacteroidetes bacterium]|nr:Gfo/Idh/MocA family oxidoreductase [Bacteroidota bacterium]